MVVVSGYLRVFVVVKGVVTVWGLGLSNGNRHSERRRLLGLTMRLLEAKKAQ